MTPNSKLKPTDLKNFAWYLRKQNFPETILYKLKAIPVSKCKKLDSSWVPFQTVVTNFFKMKMARYASRFSYATKINRYGEYTQLFDLLKIKELDGTVLKKELKNCENFRNSNDSRDLRAVESDFENIAHYLRIPFPRGTFVDDFKFFEKYPLLYFLADQGLLREWYLNKSIPILSVSEKKDDSASETLLLQEVCRYIIKREEELYPKE